MVRRPDGREALVTLELPLSLTLVSALAAAIGRAAAAAGYTDVSLLTDGSNTIVATPPAAPGGVAKRSTAPDC